jgi:hypothetical protein
MAWQRMTTAPRDGTPFLAWARDDNGGRLAVVYMSIDRTLCYDATLSIVEDDFRPTHWMPLPEPPAARRRAPINLPTEPC